MRRFDGCGERGARTFMVLLLLVTVSCQGFVASQLPLDEGFVTEASIGGTPLRVLLDTGSTGCLLDQRFLTSAGLNLPKTRSISATDSKGIERIIDVVMVKDLRIGDVIYEPGEFGAQTLPSSFSAQCLLGMGVLNSAAWCFDASRGQVLLLWPEQVESRLSARGYRVTARLPLGDDHLRPHVTVRLNGKVDAVLLLDTGATRTSLPVDIAAKLSLPPGDELARRQADEAERRWRELNPPDKLPAGVKVEFSVAPDDGESVGIHGVSTREPLVHLHTLELGDMQFEDLLVTATELPCRLGADVMGKMPWLLHGPRHELWLLERTR